jgi:hypothetical protein
VYVCLIGDDGRKLIPGVNSKPGLDTHLPRARFLLTLGNSSVTMIVDGTPQDGAASSDRSAIRSRRLAAGELPTCT